MGRVFMKQNNGLIDISANCSRYTKPSCMLLLDSFTAPDVPSTLPMIWSASTGIRVQERIVFKVVVLTYRTVYTALHHLISIVGVDSCRWCDHTSHRLSTVGTRAFPVASAYIWNGLPVDVLSAPSLPVFIQRLKTALFSRSYPNICVIWTLSSISDSGPSSIFHT